PAIAIRGRRPRPKGLHRARRAAVGHGSPRRGRRRRLPARFIFTLPQGTTGRGSASARNRFESPPGRIDNEPLRFVLEVPLTSRCSVLRWAILPPRAPRHGGRLPWEVPPQAGAEPQLPRRATSD